MDAREDARECGRIIDNWSMADEDRLIHLWNIKGLSASNCISHFPGRSREAITAKVSRLRKRGIHMRDEKNVVDRRKSKKNASTNGGKPPFRFGPVNPDLTVVEMAPDPTKEPKPNKRVFDVGDLDKVHRSCRWVYGEPHQGVGSFSYCGHQALSALPYCAYHDRVASGRRVSKSDAAEAAS